MIMRVQNVTRGQKKGKKYIYSPIYTIRVCVCAPSSVLANHLDMKDPCTSLIRPAYFSFLFSYRLEGERKTKQLHISSRFSRFLINEEEQVIDFSFQGKIKPVHCYMGSL